MHNNIGYEKPISRVLFRQKEAVTIIYLGRLLPSVSSDTTRKADGPPEILPYLVLLHVGFTKASRSPDCWCALTAPFHPYRSEIGGLNFYGTVPKVTLAGRYPAHCPVELGLSSPVEWTRLSRFLIPTRRLYHIWGTGVKSHPSPCAV